MYLVRNTVIDRLIDLLIGRAWAWLGRALKLKYLGNRCVAMLHRPTVKFGLDIISKMGQEQDPQ